jgi:hypothetical protein
LSPGGDPGVAEIKFRYLILDLRGSEGKDSRFRVPVLPGRRFNLDNFLFEEGVLVEVEDATDFSRREEFFIHGGVLFY